MANILPINSYMQAQITNVSTLISREVVSTMAVGPTTRYNSTSVVVDQIRSNYLKIVNSSRWNSLIMDIGTSVFDNLNIDEESNTLLHNMYIGTGSSCITLEPNNTIIMGRYPDCNIKLDPTNRSLSRVQAIVFRTNTKIIVIDYWSLCGTRTVRRSGTGDLVSSIPNNRCPLIFDLDESFIIQCGDNDMLVNIHFSTNECVICMEAPSMVRYTCGHGVVCNTCSNSITDCPLCRCSIVPTEVKQSVCAVPYTSDV
jgi:hypothetical protein